MKNGEKHENKSWNARDDTKKEGKKNIKRGRKICKREESEVFKKSHDEERENKIQRKEKNHEKPKIKA